MLKLINMNNNNCDVHIFIEHYFTRISSAFPKELAEKNILRIDSIKL